MQYGRILERARAEIEHNYKRSWLGRKLREYFCAYVILRNARLARVATLLRLYQRSGLQWAARHLGILSLLGLRKLEALAPPVDEHFFLDEFGTFFPAEGEARAQVAFLGGCIASVSFSELNRATIRVLNRNGIAVYVPRDQRCCGALQAHAGYLEGAREMARHNINVMLDGAYDAVITNAAGCGAMLKEYGELLESDPKYRNRARELAGKVKDITEYLADIGPRAPSRRLEARITYQDPCHLAHGQKIRRAPRQLLQALGAELVEMARPDFCCGSAGTYNVVQNQLSMQILDDKMNDISGTRADIIATANVGCMLQLRAGVAARRMKARVVHVVELLDEAYS